MTRKKAHPLWRGRESQVLMAFQDTEAIKLLKKQLTTNLQTSLLDSNAADSPGRMRFAFACAAIRMLHGGVYSRLIGEAPTDLLMCASIDALVTPAIAFPTELPLFRYFEYFPFWGWRGCQLAMSSDECNMNRIYLISNQLNSCIRCIHFCTIYAFSEPINLFQRRSISCFFSY